MKLILFTSALLAATPVLAQQKQADTLSNKTLEDVVVTATRTATAKSKIPQRITVISKKDIEQTGAQEFTDLLKKNSSVNVTQYPSLLAGISIRGFRPQTSGLNQRSLLLIDGRPAGTSNLATINPSDIDRIEVLKGSASALYGSQAMGGVVNVITRKSSGTVRGSVAAEYGSYQTFKAVATVGGNITNKLDFDLSFTNLDRNRNMKLGEGNVFRDWLNADKVQKNYTGGKQKVYDTTADGLRREYTRLNYNTGSVRLGYQLATDWKVNVKGDRFIAKGVESPSDVFYGNGRPSTKDIDRANGELSLTGMLANHELSVRAYVAEENNFSYTIMSGATAIAPYLSFESTAEWNGVQVKDVWKWKQHGIIAGIDYSKAKTKSRSYNANKTERAPFSPNYGLMSTAAYIQGQLNFLNERMVINPGLRYDLITYEVKKTPLLTNYLPGKETNPFFSPSLAAQYKLINTITIHTTIGRAFVTPDAYNVAGYSEIVTSGKANVTTGNPDLKNENSTSWDAGIQYNKAGSGFAADITYFHTNVRDRITTERTVPTTTERTESGYEITSRTTYINANKAEIRGLEAELSYDFGALQNNQFVLRPFINATKTLKAEEITIASNGSKTLKDIYNVTDLTVAYGVDFCKKGFDARLNGRYVGHRKDTDFNDPKFPEIVYPEFMVVDLSVGYNYANKHSIRLFVNNITDENYYEKRGFNLAGHNLSLRYTLQF